MAARGLAADAIRAGLVDRYLLRLVPTIVGGDTPALPAEVQVDLSLNATRRFDDGSIVLDYRLRCPHEGPRHTGLPPLRPLRSQPMSDLDDYFENKPETYALYRIIEERIQSLGPSQREIKSQISFGVNRKFAWFWLYNVTKENPNGILHLMLALDNKVEDPHIRDISQISKNRWNHQIVIRSADDANSGWLGDLLKLAFQYGAC